MSCYHLIIHGKVQGVFFRKTAKSMAQKFAITGWVKNLENGNVECEICGDHQMLENFIAWAKEGPAGAKVSNVDVSAKTTVGYQGFEIRK